MERFVVFFSAAVTQKNTRIPIFVDRNTQIWYVEKVEKWLTGAAKKVDELVDLYDERTCLQNITIKKRWGTMLTGSVPTRMCKHTKRNKIQTKKYKARLTKQQKKKY